ncbi:unnamed protein product [Sphagnum balticum]
MAGKIASSATMLALAMVAISAVSMVAAASPPSPAPTSGVDSTLAVPSYAGLALATLLSVLASMVFAQRF